MVRSILSNHLSKEPVAAKSSRLDNLPFLNATIDNFGETDLQHSFNSEKDAVLLQTCERYLEYHKTNSGR